MACRRSWRWQKSEYPEEYWFFQCWPWLSLMNSRLLYKIKEKNSFRAAITEYEIELKVNHLYVCSKDSPFLKWACVDLYGTGENYKPVCFFMASHSSLLQYPSHIGFLLMTQPRSTVIPWGKIQRNINAKFHGINNTIWLLARKQLSRRSKYYTTCSELKVGINFNKWINVLKTIQKV